MQDAGDFIDQLTADVLDSYSDDFAVNSVGHKNLPGEQEIQQILFQILELIFPGYSSGDQARTAGSLKYTVGQIVSEIYGKLSGMLARAYEHGTQSLFAKNQGMTHEECLIRGENTTKKLLASIPALRQAMKLDIQAAYAGDPAARSYDEIILAYPCVKVIATQRIAHVLYEEKVPMIPRIMTEYAHRITGIDIHPGVRLGKGFFIDHGTGVVIGETAVIGDDVRIYQGVTLGALSFPKDACGMLIKGAKRHPTIEDKVTIYAGATILGPIVIGAGSVIGGNVWLTHGTEPGTKITIAEPKLTIKEKH